LRAQAYGRRIASSAATRELASLAFALSEKRLDRQGARLDELRARTGVLLAASLVAISFLGREALERPNRAVLVSVAIGAFAVATAAVVYVVMPRATLVSSLHGSAVYEQFHETATDLEEVHRRLAYDLDAFCDTNDRQLSRLVRAFAIVAAALGVELVALVAVLGRTIA
jgi:hypothetical protein